MTDRSIGSASLTRQLGAWRAPDPSSGATYRQLADALRLLVLDGRLPLEVRLPGERDLAATLGVSRTTVGAAFALLREQGYLQSRQGSGSRTRVPAGGALPGAGLIDDADHAGILDLAAAAPPASSAVHGAYVAALEALPAHLPGTGYELVGLPELRHAIADRYTRRGLPTGPEQVLVTAGGQQALAMILRRWTTPGDRVVVDHPTYPYALDAIRDVSCRIVPVGLRRGGWDVPGMEAALRQTAPRLAYLTADFHNPTGQCMSADERAAVVAAAARARTTLVVDETLSDLWLDGPAPAPVATHDRTGTTVLTVGSMSKTFWGGLRVGWIRADRHTVTALAGMRPASDLGTALLEQLASAVLLDGGAAAPTERRDVARVARDHLVRLLAEHLPRWQVAVPPGGLSLWVELPGPTSSALAVIAPRHGVRVTAGPRFGIDGAFERHLRLPFTRPLDELDRAIPRLAMAAQGLVGTPVESRAPAFA